MGEATVVTGDTRADFMASKGKIAPSQGLPTKPVESKSIKTEVSKTAEKQETAVVEAKAAEQSKEKSSVDERISELTAKRRDAEKRAADAEKRAAELERERDIALRPKDSKPRPEDFQDPVKYGEAYGEWLADQKVRKKDEADRKEAEEKRQTRLTADWNQRYKKCQKEIDDFDDVIMAEPLSLQPWIQQAMFESEVGPQLHYYFSKDRDEAGKVNAMPAPAALRYLGRIEVRIEAENEARGKKSNVEVPPLPVPKLEPFRRAKEAPEPIKPIEGSQQVGPGGVVDADGNVTGSYLEYRNARRAGKIK
jgi:hypothetical protein